MTKGRENFSKIQSDCTANAGLVVSLGVHRGKWAKAPGKKLLALVKEGGVYSTRTTIGGHKKSLLFTE